ncbi:hypothetical protein [Streptomyces sp. TP-A0875]|uniref:hypothetical protein n=1 Tax=Streptomyces sp. TP-A0875 TaxID=552354 RepID=UPI001F27E5A7|nr:hypothetical protein [Streptomyces sp. TP-A0875]
MTFEQEWADLRAAAAKRRRGSVRRGLLVTVVAGSVFLGATGCGGGGEVDGTPKTPKDYKVVAGTQLCGGRAVTAEASKTLKVITGSSRFEASAERYTVARAAADLVEEFPASTVTKDVCRVYTPIGTPDFDLRITWRLADGVPTEPPAPNFTELKMGEDAVAAADKAYVQFACRSEKLLSSSSVGHIVIGVQHWAVPTEPEGDVQELKDAYATVAHSFSLAMARELGCEKNGGLPERPVLEPA